MADNDPADQPECDDWEITVPFIVCQSQDGPYDDESFVAGFQAGLIMQQLRSASAAGASRLTATVRTALVKQLDLIAMDAGWALAVREVEATEDYPAMADWTFATFEVTA